MDVVSVLERFAALNQSEQAWIMTTLLDFRAQNMDTFTVEYGTYVKGLITKILG